MDVPRSEYPRPQMRRLDWACLNGEWQFEIDHGDSGLERGLAGAEAGEGGGRELSGRITVPFCPESELSGVGHTDFMRAVWYRRKVAIPPEWKGRNVLLHFQAVDYDATVWVDGREVGRHRGGWTPFTCDLSGVASPGDEITITVRARDDARSPRPRGKQCPDYENRGCLYTRTTGIWQTVWMEPVPEVSLRRPRITPDVAGRRFLVEQPVTRNRAGYRVRATLRDGKGEKGEVARTEAAADLDLSPRLELAIPEDRVRLWGPGEGNLYDLAVELVDREGEVVDRVESYAGLRSVAIDGKAIKLNGRPVFQRLVLDQGYYPDGIMTAPTDEALAKDIELSMAAGFNGARLHQKVFEERFLYHADRLGYPVWGEFGDWGIDRDDPKATYVAQWLEALRRDYSHPSIVGWCPLNETMQPIGERITGLEDVTLALFLATKAADGTRPVLDTSGYAHRVPDADVYDSHDYDQNPETFRERHSKLAEGKPFTNTCGERAASVPYRGQPYFVSEFGGTWWNPEAAAAEAKTEAGSGEKSSWGYGRRPATVEEFYERFEALTGVLLGDAHMFGYCYTQITDVFQEQNGIYYFDRRPKFDAARLSAAQKRRAAIEGE